MPISDVQLSEKRWLDFFEHYKGLPAQKRGLLMLRKHIIEADPGLLVEGAEWIEETRKSDQADVPNTWEGIEMAARIAGAKFPQLVAAQWALESGWGKKPSGANNFWGLKGKGTKKQTLEEVGGQMRPEVAEFIDFPTIRAGVEYLVSRWYRDFEEHKGVNRAATVEEAARLLKEEGYATDSQYPDKLLRILAGRPQSPKLTTPAQQRPVAGYLRLTRTPKTNNKGLVELALERVRPAGGPEGFIVVSGAPGRQQFRTAAASQASSLEPLPEGLWRMEPPAWAGGVGNWTASWGPGLGPVSIPMTYLRPGGTKRTLIEAHLDFNAPVSPGTAGCIGVNTRRDMEALLRWYAEGVREIYVDWGLGTCPKPG